MGTISEKLTYLNDTKTKLKNVINYADGNITNDTFRSYPEKLYDKFVDFVTNGTDSLYSSLPKVTGENTELTLNNTANGVLKLDFKGNTSQATTTGINVLKYPYGNTTKTINGITFTDNGDGSITISGTATGNASFYLIATGSTIPDYLKTNITVRESGANGVIIQGSFDSSSGDFFANNTTINKDLSSVNTGYIRLYVQTGTSFSSPITILPYLVKGTYTSSTIPEFEKFSGGISSPNPDYPQQIHVVTGDNDITIKNQDNTQSQTYRVDFGGKNKVDFNNASYVAANYATVTKNDELYTVENGNSNSGGARFENIDLLLKPNTTYTVSALIVSTTAINGSCVYLSPGLRVEGTSVFGNRVGAGERSYVTFTTPNTLSTGNISLNPREANATAVFTDIMIEEGSTVTRYSRYVENPIELCKIGDYGDYQDYIYKDNGNWYKYNAIGKVILNSELNWKFSNGVAYMNSGVFPSNYVLNQPIYSNYYDYGGTATNTSTAYSNGNNKISLNTADGTSIYIRNDNITSASDFKTWLSTHNTEVYYVLATATSTQITDATLIEQLDEIYYNAVSYEDQTNISQTNADLPFVIGASAIRKYSE